MDTTTPRLTGPIQARVHGPTAYRGHRDELVTFPALPAAVDWVLQMLERYGQVTGWVSRKDPPWRTVDIVRVGDTELLLVGNHHVGEGPATSLVPDGAAEAAVARLLPARGYRQIVLPEPPTPIETLRPLLPTRVINCLIRYGYHTVEQVTVLPDAALLDMRSMGTGGITQIRAAISTLGTTVPPVTTITLTAQQTRELTTLLAELADLARAHDAPDLAERATILRRQMPA